MPLANSARLGEAWGYDEINLNVGCPSERVQTGSFGACLMREPALVADCVKAMRDAVTLPMTVKHRIGIDSVEEYDFVRDFVGTVAAAGCGTFIVHARNAMLKGLSPKENREVPPLSTSTCTAQAGLSRSRWSSTAASRRTPRSRTTRARRRRDARPRRVSRSVADGGGRRLLLRRRRAVAYPGTRHRCAAAVRGSAAIAWSAPACDRTAPARALSRRARRALAAHALRRRAAARRGPGACCSRRCARSSRNRSPPRSSLSSQRPLPSAAGERHFISDASPDRCPRIARSRTGPGAA